jgi:hypothetical protein
VAFPPAKLPPFRVARLTVSVTNRRFPLEKFQSFHTQETMLTNPVDGPNVALLR